VLFGAPVQVRNGAGQMGIVPETYIQMFDSSDVALPPPPPPPVTDVVDDEWGPPDPAAVAEALGEQRSSTVYSSADYEVQAALSAPSITDGPYNVLFGLFLPSSSSSLSSLCLLNRADKTQQ